MILAFDIGNNHVVIGVFKHKDLLFHWTVSPNLSRTADEYAALIHTLFGINNLTFHDISALVAASVVPPIRPVLEELSLKYFGQKPMIVGPGIKTGMPVKYDNPREVGADRIVNAVAAYELYQGPLIVVDFGTATAFCVVSAQGEYLGGALAPGINNSSEALFQRTAKLPRIELIKPPAVIARNTIQAMQSGMLYGFAGLVDGLVDSLQREIGKVKHIVATGTLAPVIAELSDRIEIVNPFLTLEGLRIIYEKNR